MARLPRENLAIKKAAAVLERHRYVRAVAALTISEIENESPNSGTASPLPALGMPLRRPGRFAERLEASTSLHDLGRSAIYWACRGLRLAPGTRIWMPALHCGVEVQAALDSGLNVGFYRLDEELNVDEEDLERKLQNEPSVVFIIHYFGFAQSSIERLASLCRNHGSVLIEDCGHALLSKYRGRELGGFAPISTFSLRKSLPIPDGGALSVNADVAPTCDKDAL